MPHIYRHIYKIEDAVTAQRILNELSHETDIRAYRDILFLHLNPSFSERRDYVDGLSQQQVADEIRILKRIASDKVRQERMIALRPRPDDSVFGVPAIKG